MAVKKVLCVCIGNGDRSPMMAEVLEKFVGRDRVVCDSAGIGASAKKGGAAKFAVEAARRIGLDLSRHVRKHIDRCKLTEYDLIVCASDEIAAKVIEAGADMSLVYNAQITNPWPVQFQEDYDGTVAQILGAMYRVICRYFSER